MRARERLLTFRWRDEACEMSSSPNMCTHVVQIPEEMNELEGGERFVLCARPLSRVVL